MQEQNPIGSISKGGLSASSFDMLGTSVFWLGKAAELDRMVCLGFSTFREDIEEIKAYKASNGLSPYQHQPSTLTVTFFLAALAIENLLKGNLIIKHPEYIKDGRFRGDVIGCHDLNKVALDAEINLDPDEADFCELGTEAIISFGRYHIGKNLSQSPTEIKVKDSFFPVYEKLYQRLVVQIQGEPWKNNATV